jgi:hypothetical protein
MLPIIRESAAGDCVSDEGEDTHMPAFAVSLPVRIQLIRAYNAEEDEGKCAFSPPFASNRARVRTCFLYRQAAIC